MCEREEEGGEAIEGKGCVCIIDHNPCGSVHLLCRLGTDGAHVCTFACHPCVRLLAWVLASMPRRVHPITTLHLSLPIACMFLWLCHCFQEK